MEQLHHNSPKLELIDLRGVYLVDNNENGGRINIETTSNDLKSFTLICLTSEDEGFDMGTNQAQFDHLLNQWITYVGKKYPEVQELQIAYPADTKPLLHELIRTNMISTLSRLPYLSTYHSRIHPYLPREIIDAIDQSGAELKTVGFDLTSNAQMQQEFNRVKSSNSAQTIEQVHVHMDSVNGVGVWDLGLKLKDLSHYLPNLAHLEMYAPESSVGLTFYILQDLTLLETFKINHMALIYPNREDIANLLQRTQVMDLRLKNSYVKIYHIVYEDKPGALLDQIE